MIYSPIIIGAYNRPEHLRKTLHSLSKCTYSEKSDVFIASDFPKNESDKEKVWLVRNIIEDLQGFRSVNSIFTDKNTNGRILTSTHFRVLQDYGISILSEDDNIFSESFLEFMNSCLKKFENDDLVFSISGYQYPIDVSWYSWNSIYKWEGFSGWGFGTWRCKFSAVLDLILKEEQQCLDYLRSILNSPKKVKKIYGIAPNLIPIAIYMINNKRILGDAFFSIYQIDNQKLNIFPMKSYVRNIGNDGSGENCSVDNENIYSNQYLEKTFEQEMLRDDPQLNAKLRKLLRQHFKLNTIGTLIGFYKLVKLWISEIFSMK
jgi:glycosyltransferase involved in cell wall biosynthesis